MLLAKGLLTRLWAEVVNTSVNVLNRTLGPLSHTTTPFELWLDTKPRVSHLRNFGCNASVLIPDIFRKKWDAKAEKLIFVCYQKESENYRLLDPETSRIFVSKNVIFNATKLINVKEETVSISVDDNLPEII